MFRENFKVLVVFEIFKRVKKMYLFIFESIGTSELMLIGLVALIVFGPRKLPEIARTIGKTMAEFRRSTDDFKQTWQQELSLEESKATAENLTDLRTRNLLTEEKSISRDLPTNNGELKTPEIKEINKNIFDENHTGKEVEKVEMPEITVKTGDKRDWL